MPQDSLLLFFIIVQCPAKWEENIPPLPLFFQLFEQVERCVGGRGGNILLTPWQKAKHGQAGQIALHRTL